MRGGLGIHETIENAIECNWRCPLNLEDEELGSQIVVHLRHGKRLLLAGHDISLLSFELTSTTGLSFTYSVSLVVLRFCYTGFIMKVYSGRIGQATSTTLSRTTSHRPQDRYLALAPAGQAPRLVARSSLAKNGDVKKRHGLCKEGIVTAVDGIDVHRRGLSFELNAWKCFFCCSCIDATYRRQFTRRHLSKTLLIG